MVSLSEMEERYPLVYGAGVYCGFWVPAEWSDIICELSSRISEYLESHTLEDFRVAQVKEKFGGLRFYVDGGNEIIEGYIRDAEDAVSSLERKLRGDRE